MVLSRADAARDAKAWDTAAALYEAVLAAQPVNAAIHIQCGHMHKEAGNLPQAELHYLQAFALTPDDADLSLQLGHFYKVAGRHYEALAAYQRAARLAPDWPASKVELEALIPSVRAALLSDGIIAPGGLRAAGPAGDPSDLGIRPVARLARPAAGYPVGSLRVCYLSGEPDTPGTHYRVDRYVEACRHAGALAEAWRLDEVDDNLMQIDHYDILVIWRARWSDTLEALLERARANGTRIVFDLDDLMIDPAFATVEIIDGIQSQSLLAEDVRRHFSLIQQTMLAADSCTSTTPELTRHMRRFGQQAITLPNGFSAETLRSSRLAARVRQVESHDGLVRLGYAGGSRTHQRDFGEIATLLPPLLKAYPDSRLVLFRASDELPLVDLEEFTELAPYAGQIEWRQMVPLHLLPDELARFDINLAPLQVGNPFCEAKSELKYFEAALAGTCTVASPTGPYKRAIQHGITGFLASEPAQWTSILTTLLDDPGLRRRVAAAALNDVLWRYGPERRAQLMRRVLPQWQRHAEAATDGFLLELTDARAPLPKVPEFEMVFHQDLLTEAAVTVVVPLHNYAHTVTETLNSVRAQTLAALDLVIIDDASTDDSLAVALRWARTNAIRFNRLLIGRNIENAGLSQTRNAGISIAETPYVLPLDADNLLRPLCCKTLLMAITSRQAAFAYPVIQEFGERTGVIGACPYDPTRLISGNYIDAMALVAKSAWSAVGGYGHMQFGGWEDYDFWCTMVERGLVGCGVPGPPLADYRAHTSSMLAKVTDRPTFKHQVIAEIKQRHPWLDINLPEEPKPKPRAATAASCLTRELRHSRK